MLSRIRKRFTYVNVAMTVALVFAMAGGAFAAGGFRITSIKQIKPSVVKQLQGKAGPAGRPGAQGPQGLTGPQGAPGAPGAKGEAGGSGSNGVSVVSKELSKGNSHCPQGGSEFSAAEGKVTYVCDGSPWTAGGTLPKGSSEHGQWSLTGNSPSPTVHSTTISFPIRLALELSKEKVHIIGMEEGSKEAKEAAAIAAGECTGTWENPGAASENLCIFVKEDLETTKLKIEDNEGTETESAGPGGAMIEEVGTGLYSAYGSWVVTG